MLQITRVEFLLVCLNEVDGHANRHDPFSLANAVLQTLGSFHTISMGDEFDVEPIQLL
jgi:hypothetical protein